MFEHILYENWLKIIDATDALLILFDSDLNITELNNPSKRYFQDKKITNGSPLNQIFNKEQLCSIEENLILLEKSSIIHIFADQKYAWFLIPSNKKDLFILFGNLKKIIATDGPSLTEFMNIFPGNCWWKNLDGVYLGCNNHLTETLKMHSSEIIGKTDFELPWRSQADYLRQHDREAIEKGSKISTIEEVTGVDGSTFYFQIIKTPLYDINNHINGTIGVSFDITKIKTLEEELKAKNAELEKVLAKYHDFISNQEHDIRTPISCVEGLSEALMDMVEDTELLETIRLIHESAKAQKAYHNSMLDGIYLFEHQTEQITRRFRLKSTIEEVQSIYACAFAEKQLHFTIEYGEGLPRFLWGDWFRLQQILICLLSNSVKFTKPEDKIWLRCQVASKEDRQFVLSIEVEDTGIGIPKEKLDAIFEPFVRLSLSNLGQYTGRGLGLTFVKKMVGELEGEIHVESIVDKGSLFHLLIPFKESLSQESTKIPQGKLTD